MTVKEIEEMNKQNKLNPKYSYYLEDLKNGFSVIRAKATNLLDKDAVICCKRTEVCQKMLADL